MKKVVALVLTGALLMCPLQKGLSERDSISVSAAQNFDLLSKYPSSSLYTADSIINGLIDLETGTPSSISVYTYKNAMSRSFSYESIANNVMGKKGLLITSAMWDSFGKLCDGKLLELTDINAHLRQEQIYELLLMDYLFYTEKSSEETGLDRSVELDNKYMKCLQDTVDALIDSEIELDKSKLVLLEEYRKNEKNPETLEAMKKFQLEEEFKLEMNKEVKEYTAIANELSVIQTAIEYIEALSKAMAFKKINDEQIYFLNSVAEQSDNSDFEFAVNNLIRKHRASDWNIKIDELNKKGFEKSYECCWDMVTGEIPVFAIFKTSKEAMECLFDSDVMAENNIRIVMQYTVGNYFRDALRQAYNKYSSNRSDETAAAFIEAYRQFLAYQCYSSDWAMDFVKNVPFASDTTVNEWLDALEMDKSYCTRVSKYIDTMSKLYNNYVYGSAYDDSDDINNPYVPDTPDEPDNDKLAESKPNEKDFYFNGNRYRVYNGRKKWNEAKSYCESLGGHLVTITSSEEQSFVESINKNTNRWIGGYRDNSSSDVWKWVTDEKWEYTNWGKGEPNNSTNVITNENCVAIWPYKWNDLNNNSSEQSGFICEWEDVYDIIYSDVTADSSKEVYNGSTYQIFRAKDGFSWESEKNYCESMGGHLLTINSEDEQMFIEELISNYQIINPLCSNELHIGGYFSTKDDEWHWVDGSKFNYTNWDVNQPDYYDNEDKISINAVTQHDTWNQNFGYWNDIDGDVPKYFICEWDHRGDVNADGWTNIADLVMLQRWLLNDGTELKYWKAGDLCEDDILNVFDLVMLKRLLLSQQ